MRRALVTGASSGIGREIAAILARRGDEVVVVARREDRLRALAAELGPARVRVLAADLADPAAADRLQAAVPDVDVLVNNAGFGHLGRFAGAEPERLASMLAVNVVALTDLTRRYLPGMLERGHGRVLNLSSTAAFQPGPLMAVYYASKAYVLSLSEALAEELRGSGVTVTALCPGVTASEFAAVAGTESSPIVRLRRLPSAADVAAFGVAAMEAGRVVAVPGAANRAGAALVRLAPRALVRRAVHRVQSVGTR